MSRIRITANCFGTSVNKTAVNFFYRPSSITFKSFTRMETKSAFGIVFKFHFLFSEFRKH